jgi:capsular polysaccharide transport system permease protein
MSLKPLTPLFDWLRGVNHSLFPIDEAIAWVEREFPEEQSAWRRFKRVVFALYLRQLQRQLAGEYSRFVWLLLEPLIMILIFTAMHTVIRGRTSSSYDILLFMGSGIVPFFLFRTILTSSLRVFKQNLKLYHYSQLRPIDAFFANALFEVSRYAIVTILLLLMAFLAGIDVVPYDFDTFIVGVLWLILFAITWGLLMGVVSHFYEVTARLVSFLSLPLLILSAVFFPLSILPPVAREWLLYNPLVHFMELIHSGYIESLDARYVDPVYMLEWTIIPLFFALWLYTNSERKFIAP